MASWTKALSSAFSSIIQASTPPPDCTVVTDRLTGLGRAERLTRPEIDVVTTPPFMAAQMEAVANLLAPRRGHVIVWSLLGDEFSAALVRRDIHVAPPPRRDEAGAGGPPPL
jgi:hypothetical protein